jgi:hypothetical protein
VPRDTNPDVTRHIGGKPYTEEESWARFLRYFGHWLLLGFGYWPLRSSRHTRDDRRSCLFATGTHHDDRIAGHLGRVGGIEDLAGVMVHGALPSFGRMGVWEGEANMI